MAELFRNPVSTQRDAGFNRVIARGAPAGSSAAAMANSVTVQQRGNGNTLVLNVTQNNTGAVVAAGSLNGSLVLD